MSEKIYAWLLRLYPTRFREQYGNEALQLFRDRVRDEVGLINRLRLWLDLLADLVVSLPREYSRVPASLVSAPAQRLPNGTPSFSVLKAEPPRFSALFFGGLLSVATLGALPYVISHFGNSGASHAGPLEPAGRYASARTADKQAQRTIDKPRRPEPMLDSGTRRRVILGVADRLKQSYVDRELGQKMAGAVLGHERAGDYDAVAEGPDLAAALTRQLRDLSNDNHIEVIYSQTPLPEPSATSSSEVSASYRQAMQQSNCTFEKTEILLRKIGYLKINSFPDASVCRQTAINAMKKLGDADALIFDLRDNRGGFPNMVALLAAYLFDRPAYLYNPRDTTGHSWTPSPVPGNKLADKPVYILTSRRTASAAEQFTYDLKMLKRATIVGETTAGAAHAGTFHRIDDHFGMGITEVRPINPFGRRDWEATGVEPDFKVNAAEALSTALSLADRQLQQK